jgi:hypothetical protein
MKTIEFNPLYCQNLLIGDIVVCSGGSEFFLVVSAKKTKNYYDIWYVKYGSPVVYKSSTNGIFILGLSIIFRK